MAMNVKKCTCCGDEFLGQGRAAYCYDCRRNRQAERNRNYYLANRERILEAKRVYRETYPERVADAQRLYRNSRAVAASMLEAAAAVLKFKNGES